MTSETRTIPLSPSSSGITTTVDAVDYEELSKHKWNARYSKITKTYYATRTIRVNGRNQAVHMAREILGLEHGNPLQADHINRNPLDNRRSNLRPATAKQNCQNRGKRSDNVTQYRGVSRMPAKPNKFRAQIWVNGKNVYLGQHETAEDAARAYDQRAIIEYGQFASLNFPQSLIQSAISDAKQAAELVTLSISKLDASLAQISQMAA